MARGEPRPGGARPRPGLDAFLNRLARYVVPHLYRDIDIVGREHFPASGPVIVIANHVNSLIDGAMLLAYLPRIPRFLAASTVWDFRAVAPFLDGSGAVRVHRRQDGREHLGSLDETFAEAADLMAAGGVLTVFPEGRTHDAPEVLAFKTGTARIALQAAATHGPLDLKIVPVGLDYEAKNRLRSRTRMEFGAPVTIAAEAAGFGQADAAGQSERVRRLTARLRTSLLEVAPHFASAQEARAMTLAGEILAAPEQRAGQGSGSAGAPSFSEIVTLRRKVQAGDARTRDAAPERTADSRQALARYATLLDGVGLADSDVTAAPAWRDIRAAVLVAVVGAPVLLIAALLNGLQALVLRSVAGRQERDKRMTWVTFGGLTVYLVTWGLMALAFGVTAGVFAGAGWGWAIGIATPLVAPLIGRAALPVVDRIAWLWRATRARRILRRPGLSERLGEHRAAARVAAIALMEATGPD